MKKDDQYKEALFDRALNLYAQVMGDVAATPGVYRQFQAAIEELKNKGWFAEWKKGVSRK